MSRRKQSKQLNVHGEAEEGEQKHSDRNGHLTATRNGTQDSELFHRTRTTSTSNTPSSSTTNTTTKADSDASPTTSNSHTTTTDTPISTDTPTASITTSNTTTAIPTTATATTVTSTDKVAATSPNTSGEGVPSATPNKRDLRGRKRKMSDSEDAAAAALGDNSKQTPPTLRFRDSSFQVNTSDIGSSPRKRSHPTPSASYETPEEELTDYSRSRSSIATALVLAAESSRRQSSRLQLAATSPSRGGGAGEGGRKRTSHRTCEYCGAIKPTPAALQRHIRKHTGERPFVCQVCHKAYKAKRSLLCHQLTHHPQVTADAGHVMNGADQVPRSKRGRKKSLQRVVLMPPHVTVSHSPPDGARASAHAVVDLDESLWDSFEGKDDPSPSSSQNGGSGKKSAQDFSANVSTISADGLDLDSDEMALDPAKRSCTYCHKEFVKPSDLKRHLMVHTGEKPFVCQFCQKGFKQPQSLNYHLKASHKVNIPLSQGLEERYLRLKTRAAMRDLAAMETWTTGGKKGGGGGQEALTPSSTSAAALYTSELSSSSFADSRPQSREMTEKENHQQLLSTIPQSLASCSSSFSPDFKQGFARQTSMASEGSWTEDRVLGPNMIEVELPQFPGMEGGGESSNSEEGGGGGRKVPMVVRKERLLLTQLDGVCPISRQEMQAFRCCLCHQAQASMLHAFLHLSAHFQHHTTSSSSSQPQQQQHHHNANPSHHRSSSQVGVGLECRPCRLAFTSQPEMDHHYRSEHNVCLDSLDLQNNNHKLRALSAGRNSGTEGGGSSSSGGIKHLFSSSSSAYYYQSHLSSGKSGLPPSDDHNNNNDDHVDKEHNSTASSPCPVRREGEAEGSSLSPSSSGGFLGSAEPSEALKWSRGKGAHRCSQCSKSYMTKFLLDRHLAFHSRQDLIEAAMRGGVAGGINGMNRDLLLNPPPVVPQDAHRYLQLQELDMALKAQQQEEEEEEEQQQEFEFSGQSFRRVRHAVLEQEGIEEEVVVVMPTDPDTDDDEDLSPETESPEMDVGSEELKDDETVETGIHVAPKRQLIPPKSEPSPSKRQKSEASLSKSRRKTSIPTRHRAALRGLDSSSAPLLSPASSPYPSDKKQPQPSASSSQQAEDHPSNSQSGSSSPKRETPGDGASGHPAESEVSQDGQQRNNSEVGKDLEEKGDDDDLSEDLQDGVGKNSQGDDVIQDSKDGGRSQEAQMDEDVEERDDDSSLDLQREDDEVGQEMEGTQESSSLLQNLHSAFSRMPPNLLASLYSSSSSNNGAVFSPASLAAASSAAAAGYLRPFPHPHLPGPSSFSLHAPAASSVCGPSSSPSSSSLPLPPRSPQSDDDDDQVEDVSVSSGGGLSSTPATSLSASHPPPPALMGFLPRVLWDSPTWSCAAAAGERSPPHPLSSSSSSANGRRVTPMWHTLSSEDLSSAATTDGRKVTSLSRTHSRLYVVNQPVDRERLCKPTNVGDGRTVYRCIFCHKDFLSYSDINRHMDFHEDIRPYKCNFCDYYARTNSQLKVHMMRHQGIREYCCQLCKYKGVTQSDLNRHMKSQIHLLKSQNECAKCGEGFVTPKTLEKHLATGCKTARKKKEKQEN